MQSLKNIFTANLSGIVLLILCFSFPWSAFAEVQSFKKIVVFGTSLSDSGNAFVVLSDPESFGFGQGCNPGVPANMPPYDTLDALLIPDGTYAKGGHHVSNGVTWVEQLARNWGMPNATLPALRDEGIQAGNYAIGGARAVDFDCRFNLSDQVEAYLNDSPEITDETLFVFELGSNDIRDAMVKLAEGEDIDTVIAKVLVPALSNIVATIQGLYDLDARKFLLVNVPAVGETPALKLLDLQFPGSVFAANTLTAIFNTELENLQYGLGVSLPGIEVRMLDLYSLLNNIIADPNPFGVTNTQDTCLTPNVPPFQCKNPDAYLFWDGIHPTKAVHGIIARKAVEVLLMPVP